MTAADLGAQRVPPAFAVPERQPKYLFVGTNFHCTEHRWGTKRYMRSADAQTFPTNVTLGFRKNFWRVFSSLSEYDTEDFDFEWLGQPWRFRSFWLSDSNNVDFSAYIEDEQNVFLIFVIESLREVEVGSIRQLIFAQGLDEQSALKHLFDCFRDQPFYGLFSVTRHKDNLNALFLWSTSQMTTTLPNAIAMFSFFSFGLLMTWQIARDVTDINLSIEQRYFQQNLEKILRIRGKTINLERYFLTKNISNDHNIKLVASQIKERFQLEKKQERFLVLIQAMEQHVLTAGQLQADKYSRRLNNFVLTLTMVGLPLSLMSMLVAFDPAQNAIFQKGHVILLSRSSLLFFISCLLFSSIAVSSIFLLLSEFQKDRRAPRER